METRGGTDGDGDKVVGMETRDSMIIQTSMLAQ